MIEKYNKNEIIKKVKENDWKIIDDHTDKELSIVGIVELMGGDLCPLFDSFPQRLNLLYTDLDEKFSYLSKDVSWGNIYSMDIDDYNRECSSERRKIKRVIYSNGEELTFDIKVSFKDIINHKLFDTIDKLEKEEENFQFKSELLKIINDNASFIKEDIINGLNDNNWTVIDNLTGCSKSVSGIVEFIDNEYFSAILQDNNDSYFFRAIYLSRTDNMVHIARFSIDEESYGSSVSSLVDYMSSCSIIRNKIKEILFCNGSIAKMIY